MPGLKVCVRKSQILIHDLAPSEHELLHLNSSLNSVLTLVRKLSHLLIEIELIVQVEKDMA